MDELLVFIIAKRCQAEALLRSTDPTREFPGIHATGINGLMLRALCRILRGQTKEPEGDPVQLLAKPPSGGPWVSELSAELIDQLANLEPKQFGDVASDWAATSPYWFGSLDLDVARQRLDDLAGLCQYPLAKGDKVLMWVRF